jgi:hypothetical protein
MKNDSIINWELWCKLNEGKNIKLDTKFNHDVMRIRELIYEQKPDNLMPWQADNPQNTGKVSANLTPDDLVRGAENASTAIQGVATSPEFWEWMSIPLAFVPVLGTTASGLSLLWSAKLRYDEGDNLGAGLNVMFAFLPYVGAALAAKAKPVLQKLLSGTKPAQLTAEEMKIFNELGSKAPLLKSSVLSSKYGVDKLLEVVNKNSAKLTTLLGADKFNEVKTLLSAAEGLSPVETKTLAKKISQILSSANLANALRVLSKAKTPTKFVQKPTTWTHLTSSPEIIPNIVKTGQWITPGENLLNFTTKVDNASTLIGDSFFVGKQNALAPNLQKGKFFSTPQPNHKFLITTDLAESAFQPNINRVNWSTFEQSKGVGVLKPQFRDMKNFNFYLQGDDGVFYLLDKNILKTLAGQL